MAELNADEQAIIEMVREFVDSDVRPVAQDLEHANTYPEKLIGQMKGLGIFGLAIPEPYGEHGHHALLRAGHRGAGPRVDEPGRRDGRSHGRLQAAHGASVPTSRSSATCRGWPPASCRATMALTEPGGGSDLQAMRTDGAAATRDGYVINGSKTWITNARRADLVALLCKTDPAADRRTPGVSILLVDKTEGCPASMCPATCPSSATRASRAAS